jgi:spore maturation protein CgeB
MRFLIADTVYPGYVQWLYSCNPQLGEKPYAEQYRATVAGGFHTASAWAEPLQSAGHDVLDVWADHLPLQMRWCQENGATDVLIRAADAYRFSGTLIENAKGYPWYLDVVAEQVRRFKPDVLLLANLYAFDARFLAKLHGHYKIAIGQHAAALPQNDLTGYHTIISSLPNQVAQFQRQGLRADLVKLAFDRRLLARLAPGTPKFDFVFAGQVSGHHRSRAELLLRLGREIHVDVFGNTLWSDTDLAGTRIQRHAALWGMPMYQALRDARIVFNSHIDAAGAFANNLRLYEVTGVGSLLLTDWKENLTEMFVPGLECAAYRSVDECVRLARHYLAHEEERATIAAAGQRRALAEHTYEHRVPELLGIVESAGAGRAVGSVRPSLRKTAQSPVAGIARGLGKTRAQDGGTSGEDRVVGVAASLDAGETGPEVSSTDSVFDLVNLASRALADANHAMAAGFIQAALTRDGGHTEALVVAVRLALETNDADMARGALDILKATAPDDERLPALAREFALRLEVASPKGAGVDAASAAKPAPLKAEVPAPSLHTSIPSAPLRGDLNDNVEIRSSSRPETDRR